MPASLCGSVGSGWMCQITISFHVFSERHSCLIYRLLITGWYLGVFSLHSAGRILHCILCTLQRFKISMQCVVVSAKMLSSSTGGCAVQWTMWKGGALPPVTGLTDQRIICCFNRVELGQETIRSKN